MSQQFKLDISLESWLNKLEQELIKTEAYQQSLTQLEQLIDDQSEPTQQLLRGFTQEILQLTVRHFSQLQAKVPQRTVESAAQNQSRVEKRSPLAHPVSELTQAQVAPEAPISQQRTERLRSVGQRLQHTRESQGLSRQQLHCRTLIPIHHIQALEEGDIKKLPEDIFVRGFTAQLGQALGLDGKVLADSIPQVSSSVLPSWSPSPTSKTSIIHRPRTTLTLYFGYAVLVASAVMGLSWSLDRAQSRSMVEYNVSPIQEAAPEIQDKQVTSQLRASEQLSPPGQIDN